MAGEVRRFDVYWAAFDPAIGPTIGVEIKKTRPVAIVSPDELNRHLGSVICAPLTSSLRRYPFRPPVVVSGARGQVALDQIRALDTTRLQQRIGRLNKEEQERVLSCLMEMFAT
jgi:mRNA interferase MazF